jgi:eukaryotic-like serine/threonine-protein kinase
VLETLQQVKTAEPVAPTRLVPGLPRDIETIVLKCLQRDPAKRYESGEYLAEDLLRFQAGRPIVARPVGSLERTARWCRRNPTVAGLSTGVAFSAADGRVAAGNMEQTISLWDPAGRRPIQYLRGHSERSTA